MTTREERILTTDEIRRGWVDGNELFHYEVGSPNDAEPTEVYEARFDRWLAKTVRAAKAEAWDEAVEEAFSLGSLYDYDRDEALIRNPYQSKEGR